MTPKRIQRKRVKGWRKPHGTIIVMRPGKFANPFNWKDGVHVGSEAWAKGAAVLFFREWLDGKREAPNLEDRCRVLDYIEELRGHDLACTCGPADPCHADVLLELANTPLL